MPPQVADIDKDAKRFFELLNPAQRLPQQPSREEKPDEVDEDSIESDAKKFFELLGIEEEAKELPPPVSLTPSPLQADRDMAYHEAQEPEKEPDDSVRLSLAKALQTKIPERQPNYNPIATDDTWDRWWINTEDRVNAALRLRNATTDEEKKAGVKDYANAMARFRSDIDLMENVKTLANPRNWSGERRKEYNTRLNAIAVNEAEKEVSNWMIGKGVTPIPSDRKLLDELNKRHKTSYGSLDEAMQSIKGKKEAAEKEVEKAAGKESLYDVAHAGASFLSWPHHLEKAGEFTGTVLGEASSVVSGVDKGKYFESFWEGKGYGQDEEGFEERLRREGVSHGGVGLASVGKMAPDIATALIASPAVYQTLRAMRIPAPIATAIKGPVSFGSTLAAKEYGLTGGDVQRSISSGLMGMAIPPVYKKLSDGAGRLLLTIYKKSPNVKGAGKIAEELAGLSGVMALTETQSLGEWLSADSQEEKDRLLGEFLGRFAGFAIPAPIMAKGRKDPVKPKAEWSKTEEIAQQSRDINLAVERIKADPEAMKALENALNKHWDGFETVPKADVGAAIKARQDQALSKMSEKARSAFERVEDTMSGEKEKELDWDLFDLPVTQLRKIAKELGIKQMDKKPADVIIEAIKDHRLKSKVEVALEEGKIEAEPEPPVEPKLQQPKGTHFEPSKGGAFGEEGRVLGFLTPLKDGYITDFVRSGTHEGAAGEVLRNPKLADTLSKETVSKIKEGQYHAALVDAGYTMVSPSGKGIDLVAPNIESMRASLEYIAVNKEGGLKGFSEIRPHISGYRGLSVDLKTGELKGIKEPPKPTDPVVEPLKGEEVASDEQIALVNKSSEVKGKLQRGEITQEEHDQSQKDILKEFNPPEVREIEPKGKLPSLPPPEHPMPSHPVLPQLLGEKRERAFTKRAVKYMEERGEKERAEDFKSDPDTLYDQIRSDDVKQILQSMDKNEFNDFYRSGEGVEKIGPAIEIESIRRLELEGKKGEADIKIMELGKKMTTYGQWIQQATHYGITNERIIRMVDSHLESIGKEPLTDAQKNKIEHLLTISKKALDRKVKAENAWLKKPTLSNEVKMGKATLMAQWRAERQAKYLHGFNPRGWSDILVTGVQGNLLSPASFVLNAGANLLIRPLRAGARGIQSFLDPALELVFQVDRKGNVIRGKGLLGKSKKLREPQFPTPYKSLKRTLKGFEEGMGFRKLLKYMNEEYADYSLLKRGRGAGLGRKPREMSEHDWRGAKNAVEMIRKGATENPYEAEGSALAPANAALARKNLLRMWQRDTARSPSIIGRMNEVAKALFEGSVGTFPDLAFRFLYAGDIGFRRAAEHRIIGRLAERKLKEDGVPEAEWAERVDKAIKRPDLFFNEKELKWVEDRSAAEVYQQEGRVTRFAGSAMREMKNVPYVGGALHLGARMIVPYQKTPINITGEILSYTPTFGFANMGIKGGKAAVDPSRENVHEFNEAASKWTAGLGVSHFGSILFANNLVQPSLAPYQDEPRRVRLGVTKALPAGHLNFSGLKRWAPIWMDAMTSKGDERVRLKRLAYDEAQWREGDVASNLLRVGPTGAIIMAGVDSEEKMSRLSPEERGKLKDVYNKALANLSTTTQFMLNQTYTKTPSEGISLIAGDPKIRAADFWSRLAETATAMGIPRTFSWYDMINEEDRPTYSNDPLLSQMANKIQARLDSFGLEWIPLGKHRADLPVIRDFRGEKVLRNPEGDKYVIGMKVGPSIWNLLGISKTAQTSIKDPAVAEMQRLYLELKDDKGGPLSTIFPDPVSPVLSVPFKNYKGTYDLTPKQYEELQEIVGKYRFKGAPDEDWIKGGREKPWGDGVDSMVNSPEYWAEGMTDKGRADLFRENYMIGKERGVRKFIENHTDKDGILQLKLTPLESGRGRP